MLIGAITAYTSHMSLTDHWEQIKNQSPNAQASWGNRHFTYIELFLLPGFPAPEPKLCGQLNSEVTQLFNNYLSPHLQS